MATLRSTIDALSADQVQAGIAKDILVSNPWLDLPLQWVGCDSLFQYKKITTGATASFVNIDTGAGLSNSNIVASEASVPTKAIVGQSFVPEMASDMAMMEAYTEISSALEEKFGAGIVTGDSNANAQDFDGLARATVVLGTDDVSTASTDGDSFTVDHMELLADEMKKGIDAFVMNAATVRRLRALERAAGNNLGQVTIAGHNFTAFDGIPILKFDAVATNVAQGGTANTTSIYGVRFAKSEFDRAGMLMAYNQKYPLGLNVRNIGVAQDALHEVIRGSWYCTPVFQDINSVKRIKGLILS